MQNVYCQNQQELIEIINKAHKLKNLSISNNDGDSFACALGCYKTLTSLKQSDVKFFEGYYSSPNVENWQHLTILVEDFKQLPTEIGQLSYLTDLTIDCFNLDVLPAEIRQLQSLISLTLHRCNLKTLPAEIAQLSNLTNLNFYECYNKSELLAEIQLSEKIEIYNHQHSVLNNLEHSVLNNLEKDNDIPAPITQLSEPKTNNSKPIINTTLANQTTPIQVCEYEYPQKTPDEPILLPKPFIVGTVLYLIYILWSKLTQDF